MEKEFKKLEKAVKDRVPIHPCEESQQDANQAILEMFGALIKEIERFKKLAGRVTELEGQLEKIKKLGIGWTGVKEN